MMVRRLISAHMDFVILNFSFEFHTILWAFDEQKFLTLTFLDVRMHVSFLCFLLASNVFELNFSARDMVHWSATQVYLVYCVMRSRFDANPKREAI